MESNGSFDSELVRARPEVQHEQHGRTHRFEIGGDGALFARLEGSPPLQPGEQSWRVILQDSNGRAYFRTRITPDSPESLARYARALPLRDREIAAGFLRRIAYKYREVFQGSTGPTPQIIGTAERARQTAPSATASATTAPVATATAPWGPLPDLNARPLPMFPLDALPGWLRSLATDLGRFIQVPPESVAVLALGILSAAARGAFVVRVKPGYEELVVLFVLLAMSSGSRKGPLYDALAKPLYDWEADARERMQPVRVAKQAEKKRREAELKKAEREGNAQTIAEAATALATCKVPPEPRLICADITLEKLGSLMHEQDGTMAALSPEAVLFGIIGGRYNDGAPNVDLLLMAYSGEPVTVDRIGREGVNLRHAKLTIALTVQLIVLQEFLAHPVYRPRGLVARFLFCLPPSLVGTRLDDPDAVPEHLLRNWRDRCERLLARAGVDPGELTLSPEAYRIYRDFYEETERLMAPGQPLARVEDWANKAAGTAVRIAGLLHLANTYDADPLPVQIPATTMESAVTLAGYFREVARVLLTTDDPVRADLRKVVAWMQRTGRTVVTRRDVSDTLDSSRREGASGWQPVMDEGVAVGVFRLLPVERGGGGGRTTQKYRLHPELAAEGSEGNEGL